MWLLRHVLPEPTADAHATHADSLLRRECCGNYWFAVLEALLREYEYDAIETVLVTACGAGLRVPSTSTRVR